jgi:hypothetical protein
MKNLSEKEIKDLGKIAIDYDRQVVLCGKEKADNALQFWQLGYIANQSDNKLVDLETLKVDFDNYCFNSYPSSLSSSNIRENVFSFFKPHFAHPTEDKEAWVSVEDKGPLCWESGNWDGLKSDIVLVYSNEITIPATAYEGFLDGSKYLNFYDYRDCEITKPTHWMPLPKAPETSNKV